MSDNIKAIEYSNLENQVLQVTTALYRVTDLYSDSEPIKWMLRKDAIDLVSYISNSVIANKAALLSDDLQHAQNKCNLLRQKLTVLKSAGYISKINIEVLENEYTSLLDIISAFIKDMSFTIPQIDIKDNPKGHLVTADKSFITDTSSSEIKNVGKKSSREPSSTNERQEAIKNILRGHEWLSVIEVTAFHKGSISSKTVQRDLTVLLDKGIVKTKGERRWRKYMLIK